MMTMMVQTLAAVVLVSASACLLWHCYRYCPEGYLPRSSDVVDDDYYDDDDHFLSPLSLLANDDDDEAKEETGEEEKEEEFLTFCHFGRYSNRLHQLEVGLWLARFLHRTLLLWDFERVASPLHLDTFVNVTATGELHGVRVVLFSQTPWANACFGNSTDSHSRLRRCLGGTMITSRYDLPGKTASQCGVRCPFHPTGTFRMDSFDELRENHIAELPFLLVSPPTIFYHHSQRVIRDYYSEAKRSLVYADDVHVLSGVVVDYLLRRTPDHLSAGKNDSEVSSSAQFLSMHVRLGDRARLRPSDLKLEDYLRRMPDVLSRMPQDVSAFSSVFLATDATPEEQERILEALASALPSASLRVQVEIPLWIFGDHPDVRIGRYRYRPNWSDGLMQAVLQHVCARGSVFVGVRYSSYSKRIVALKKEYHYYDGDNDDSDSLEDSGIFYFA